MPEPYPAERRHERNDGMTISRRWFLKCALGVSAAAVLSQTLPDIAAAFTPPGPPMPRLYGDGYHDDTPALQALIDGKPVMFDGAVRYPDQPGTLHLPSGTFRFDGPINVRMVCGEGSIPVIQSAGAV